jgi:oligopeptide/dipeptide ABC transporter ATP-binding protein
LSALGHGGAARPEAERAEVDNTLELRRLTVAFPTRDGLAVAVNDVSLSIAPGQVTGIVGESGSGKTMICRAILGLVPRPGAILAGEILWRGRDLASASPSGLRRVRGREVAMIFQDPSSALDPLFTIGDQIAEPLRAHRGLSRSAAETEAIELLGRVGIPSPRERVNAYPHQLSGGMRQRAMIAIAISCKPALVLADEPTTSLDVTIQDQILGLLAELRDEYGMSMVLVSHDLGVIAQNADTVAVMYSGSIVETAPTAKIFSATRHPYTAALIQALPTIHVQERRSGLEPIPGQPPSLDDLPPGCPFGPRCQYATDACQAVDMTRVAVGDGHDSACPFAETVMVAS